MQLVGKFPIRTSHDEADNDNCHGDTKQVDAAAALKNNPESEHYHTTLKMQRQETFGLPNFIAAAAQKEVELDSKSPNHPS